jgi:hypothetical protein
MQSRDLALNPSKESYKSEKLQKYSYKSRVMRSRFLQVIWQLIWQLIRKQVSSVMNCSRR